ncbi:pentatricopeptide repeat-containing protein At2g34400 [Selaginella moellendorffii]|nr:pentatricopeptide repeat-containing protein At2g34400 [Selaginella moellendorffii]|eukprot:XP_002990408.2 pentatricopeptide repeat-containing protein At2g34400 [Selaginella moellendorffii]
MILQSDYFGVERTSQVRAMPRSGAPEQSRSLLMTVCRQKLEIPKSEDAMEHSAKFAARDKPRKLRDQHSCSSTTIGSAGGLDSLRCDVRRLEDRSNPSSLDVEACGVLLRRCALHRALEEGKRLHRQIVASRESCNTFLVNLVVLMYGSCGRIHDALQAFHSIDPRNAHSWNIMIAAFSQNGHPREALDLYWKMDPGLSRSSVSYCAALGLCAKLGAIADGRKIHESVRGTVFESYGGAGSVGIALVNMYGKCACPDDARIVFDKLRHRSNVCWNAMISAYAQNQRGSQAIDLFRRMDHEGMDFTAITFVSVIDACAKEKLSASRELLARQIHARAAQRGLLPGDVIVGSALVNMYGKWGMIRDAQALFDSMERRNCFTWSGMIAAYAQIGQPRRALELFRSMDVRPNNVTLISVLDACTQLGDAATAKIVRELFDRSREEGVDRDGTGAITLGNALINFYAKVGDWELAREIFERMPRKSVVTWTSMLSAYARNGHSAQALELFHRMEGFELQSHPVTIISALDACADGAGSLKEGRRIHQQLLQSGIKPDGAVANAVISMYGKSGSVSEAWEVFAAMTDRSVVSWTSILAAFAEHQSIDEAFAIQRMMCQEGMDPDDVTFISLLFACSHAGKLEQGREVFLAMVADFDTRPMVEHYRCMVDLLARTGRLAEAEELVRRMPGGADLVCWSTLLNGCKLHDNEEHAKRAADGLSVATPGSSGAFVLLAQSLCAKESSKAR